MSETTFNEDFSKALRAVDYNGFDLEDFETMLIAYKLIMERREPQAKLILQSCELIHDSLEI